MEWERKEKEGAGRAVRPFSVRLSGLCRKLAGCLTWAFASLAPEALWTMGEGEMT